MYCYQAYGLTIVSEFELPRLLCLSNPNEISRPSGGLRPVRVTLGSPLTAQERMRPYKVQFNEEGVAHAAYHWGHLQVQLIGAITVRPDRAASQNLQAWLVANLGSITAAICGLGLAIILNGRGYFLVHASVVGGPDGAALIAGQSGAGKSTLAVYLARKGFSLLSDDCAALRYEQQGWLVQRGITTPKLSQVSQQELKLDDVEIAGPSCERGKHPYHLSLPLPAPHMKLKALYFLDVAEHFSCTPLGIPEAHRLLNQNRFRRKKNIGLSPVETKRICLQIVSHVPAASICRTEDFSSLDLCAEMLRAHIGG